MVKLPGIQIHILEQNRFPCHFFLQNIQVGVGLKLIEMTTQLVKSKWQLIKNPDFIVGITHGCVSVNLLLEHKNSLFH